MGNGLDLMSGGREASEQRFKALFEKAPLGIALIDSLTGEIRAANRMFSKIAGRTEEEMLAADWMSITHPDDVQKDLDQMALLNAGKISGFQMDKRYLRPDASVVWISMTIAPITVEDKARPHHLCMIEDITERKQAEKYGEITREILKILNSPGDPHGMIEGIVAALKTETAFDAVGIRLKQGGNFPYAAQLGFPEEFLRTENSLTECGTDGETCRKAGGSPRLECTCGLVLSGLVDRSSPLFTAGGSFWTNDSFELLNVAAEEDLRHHPRNNCIKQRYASIALVPIKNKNEIIGLIQLNNRRKGSFTPDTVKFVEAIATHIGAALMRKRAEDELKESENRFLDILYASTDAILLIDGNRFVDCNDATARMIGYEDRTKFLVSHPSELSPATQPDGRKSYEKAEEMIRTAMANGFHRFEWVHRKPNGEDFPIEVTLTPITMRGRTMLHCVWRDLTEHQKNAEAAANVNKLESLGILAGGIAHDFNNILTAILGNLSLMQPKLKGDGAVLELLNEAQDACGTAKSLSNQLLTFAKGGNLVVSVMDLRPALTKAAVFATRGTNARCVFELGKAPLPVSFDKDQISRVIQNLVINAVQAMPQGGTITMRAATVELEASENPRRPAGRYFRVTVEDQGAGIKPANLQKIFDPYFSTKGLGRGLGLAMCYSIMAKHGGNIGAELRPGGGALFALHFPAAIEEAPAPRVPPPATAAAKGRVLVMDDEPPVARILKRMLEHLGYSVDSLGDGESAVGAYRKALADGARYDAVILDLTVRGGMGGLEAMATLEALDPKVKAIVSSGYANDPILAEYAGRGFSGALVKPYRLDEVSAAVGKVLGSAGA